MKKVNTLLFVSLISLSFTAYAVDDNARLETGADRVIITTHISPQGCQKIDSLSSTQINGVSTAYSSKCALEKRALREIQTQAAREGANVISITKNQATYRTWPGYRKIDTVTLSGIAYQCSAYALDRIQPLSLSDIRQTQIPNACN